ncbi:hypothetical protein FFLO_03434 [Filobasidium floriforme]|uniref:Glutamate decarboxylase n=1 Tax=Filobasidium floriforme TaxID=5210 RepID=A0A8K0NQU3_9TREE|nr:hypothetical protein FFLO_03434 [Filobasidium floriforme]
MVLLGEVSDVHKDQSKKPIAYVDSLVYGSSAAARELPEFEMAEEPMPSETAYQLVHDELELDGTPALNLASFVTTYMDSAAEKLMMENMNKNAIDYEEYPATVDLQNRCVNMIGRLFNAPTSESEGCVGTSTVGSSEAIILATLAMKRKWQHARKAARKPYDRPNMVMNAAVQVCWEKATRYLEVEERYVYCTQDRYIIDPQEAVDLCDENTIGVCGILGLTYTGEYEDIKTLSDKLDQLEKDKGLDIKIHVDAASGGMVAPFCVPDLEWDFRLPRVVSINTSGHKYGMTYAGIGWALWRSKEYLPEDLIFHVNYLGADQASFTLNFSKSAAQIVGPLTVLIRNGKSGFRAIMQSITETSDYLAAQLEATGRFTIMNPRQGKSLPLVAFRLKGDNHFNEYDVASTLRSRGNWIVPAYTMAPKAESLRLLRVVCRMDFSRSRCNALVRDLVQTLELLDKQSKEAIESHRELNSKHKKSKAKHHHGHESGNKDNNTLQSKTGKTHAVC